MRYLLAIQLILLLSQSLLPQDEKKIYTREEFKVTVMGKTEAEVKKALGTANRSGSKKWGNSNVKVWEYDGIVRDKDAKEVDESTWVWFGDWAGKDGDRVNRVSAGKKPR